MIEQLLRTLEQVGRLKRHLESELTRMVHMGGGYPKIVKAEESAPDLPESERAKCPLCQRVIGLNKNSPFLAYADSPRTRHLMDVHKRSLDEAQELIKKFCGR